MNKIGIVGFSGFIGKEICDFLQNKDYEVFYFGRSPSLVPQKSKFSYFSHDKPIDNYNLLKKCDVVIYLAGVSKYNNSLSIPKNLYFKSINCDLTIDFARAAISVGVKRFIFISSIKVNGEKTDIGQRFSEKDIPAPEDAYAQSKLDAERGLLSLAAGTGMEVVIIRPPLVYGPDVKGNFGMLINYARKGIPLPLGAINNRRSLVSLGNLVDLIATCIDHSEAANQIFLVGDGNDLSTTELMRGIAKAAMVPSRLIPVPVYFLELTAFLLRKKMISRRVLDSLQVDITKARNLLGWSPPFSVEEGLRSCFKVKK